MAEKLIPPRLCGWCHEPFTPRRAEQQYCPRPAACAYRALGRQRKGIAPEAAVAGKKRRDARITIERCRGALGELSERDHAVFAFAYRAGYDVGYQAAYAPTRAKRTEAA